MPAAKKARSAIDVGYGHNSQRSSRANFDFFRLPHDDSPLKKPLSLSYRTRTLRPHAEESFRPPLRSHGLASSPLQSPHAIKNALTVHYRQSTVYQDTPAKATIRLTLSSSII
jgi:hypothetical protein